MESLKNTIVDILLKIFSLDLCNGEYLQSE